MHIILLHLHILSRYINHLNAIGIIIYILLFIFSQGDSEQLKSYRLPFFFWLSIIVGNIIPMIGFGFSANFFGILIHGFYVALGISNLKFKSSISQKIKIPPRKQKLIFISTGEPSGDILGFNLIQDLLKYDQNLKFIGIGGPLMRSQNFESIMLMENFQYLGFKHVFLSLFKILRQFFFIKRTILKLIPDIVIFIDLPDIHLKLEKSLKKHHFPGKIIHYVCPSIWAWRKNRKQLLEENLDLLLTILPFEKKIFEKTNSPLRIEYVGHPLAQTIEHYQFNHSWKTLFCIPEETRSLAVFPGSRIKDIENNLQLQLLAIKKSGYNLTHSIIISYANESIKLLLEKVTRNLGLNNYFPVPCNYRYEMMQDSDLILAKCGTIVLETALIGTPTLVSCLLCPMDALIARYIFGLGSGVYALPNLILDNPVFPEFIGEDMETLSTYLARGIRLFENPQTYNNCVHQCMKLRAIIHNPNEQTPAARAILSLIKPEENYMKKTSKI